MALDVEQLRAGVLRRFAGQVGMVAVFLFGSNALGRSGPLSDVDIAVLADVSLGEKARHEVHLAAIGQLLDLLPGADLDVIMLNDAPPALQYRVLQDGILLLCRDREALVLFKALAISMYLDFKEFMAPYLDHHPEWSE